MAVCGLLLMLCTPFGTAIPLSSFYPYGSAAGDTVLPPNDDGSSSAISLPRDEMTTFQLCIRSSKPQVNTLIRYISWN